MGARNIAIQTIWHLIFLWFSSFFILCSFIVTLQCVRNPKHDCLKFSTRMWCLFFVFNINCDVSLYSKWKITYCWKNEFWVEKIFLNKVFFRQTEHSREEIQNFESKNIWKLIIYKFLQKFLLLQCILTFSFRNYF